MIEHEFPYDSFIGGWYIPDSICDDIVNYFYEQKDNGLTTEGKISKYGKLNTDTDVKDKKSLLLIYLIV